MKRNHGHKEQTEVQSLRKENKRLKEEVRSLTRHIKQLERFNIQYIEEEEVIVPTTKWYSKCPSCNIGNYESIELVGRRFSCCDSCGFRSKAVKVQE